MEDLLHTDGEIRNGYINLLNLLNLLNLTVLYSKPDLEQPPREVKWSFHFLDFPFLYSIFFNYSI